MVHEVGLVDPGSGDPLDSVEFAGKRIFVIADHQHAVGVFKAKTRETAGTTIIAQPVAGGSISLHDILISAEKKQSGELTLQFTDGTNTEAVFAPIVTDAPVNIGMPIKGKWRGWKDARVEMVTAGATFKATITLGYAKLADGLEFSEWDGAR